MNDTPNQDVKVFKANKALQEKIGTGPLDEKAVERAEHVMENNDVDFAPLAMEYLDKLEAAIKDAQKDSTSMDQSVQDMTAPVMQLKANAATFKYNLIGNMANIMLSFLEGIKNMDADAVAIVTAHHQTLKAIVGNKMTGDGGAAGKEMEKELKAACKRYFSKRS